MLMTKKCVFNKNKDCVDCGECYRCELDNNKICDNCGKCMEKEGIDLRAIKIDEVLDMPQDIDEYIEDDFVLDDLNKDDENSQDIYEKGDYEYIEDNDDLIEMLYDENKFHKMADEVFPGLIKLKRKK